MIKNKKKIMGLGMLLFLCCLIFAEDQIVIESKLFRGINQTIANYPQEVIVSSFSTPLYLPEISNNTELKSGSITSLKNELNKVFQMQHIDHLISGNMIWDGKKAILKETFSFDEFSYPIQFTPQVTSTNSINLRIEMYREKNIDILRVEEKEEKLLDTEIVVNFDQPIIFGFPINGNTYFLSINLTRGSIGGLLRGEVIRLPNSTRIVIPPRPVYKFNPVYPSESRYKRIEGTVVLEVSTDTKGFVNKVKVLKSVDPDLDKAAILTLKQWKYEPVRIDEKPVNVVFMVAVDFKLKMIAKSQSSKSNSNEKVDLETILKRSAEYCERLSNSALHFVCEETIEEELRYGSLEGTAVATSGRGIVMRGGSQKIELNKYVYDYQLIKKGEKIEESRILLKENGKKKHEENAPMKTKRFYSKRSVYGPVGLLGKEQQGKYDYKIIKEQTIKKRKTYVIEVTPKTNIEGNPNFGKVWVDKEDFSVLKIEIEQESLAGFEKIEQESKTKNISPIITTTHDYFIEKNGIRFPSKTVCKEVYLGRRRTRSKISETKITYDNYRFFLVDVKIKY